MARRGSAGRGLPRHGRARRGRTRQGESWLGVARHGAAGRSLACQGGAPRGGARLGGAGLRGAGPGEAWYFLREGTMDEREEFEVAHHPPWREALRRFRAAGFGPGDVIDYEWFYDALGLIAPGEKTSYREGKQFDLLWVRNFSELRSALLEEDNVDLLNKQGVGYEIALPSEQSERACRDGWKELRAALRKMTGRILHTDVSRLTAEQRVANANDLARAAAMANALRGSRRLLTHREEEEA